MDVLREAGKFDRGEIASLSILIEYFMYIPKTFLLNKLLLIVKK